MHEAYLESHLAQTHYSCLTYIPASKSALRRRGFDHMELIAQEFSSLSQITLKLVLQKRDNKDQRKLSKFERKDNMKDAFKIIDPSSIEGASILLLDDVITTGATINEAAKSLKEGGVMRVDVLAFARVW